jgi:hypothetical protein
LLVLQQLDFPFIQQVIKETSLQAEYSPLLHTTFPLEHDARVEPDPEDEVLETRTPELLDDDVVEDEIKVHVVFISSDFGGFKLVLSVDRGNTEQSLATWFVENT